MAKYTLNKKRPDEISERARRLNEQSITVNIHDHTMFEFAIRKALGQKDIFNTYYLPQLKRGCFNVVATTIGSNSPCLSNLTDDLVFGAMEQWDMLREEEKISGAFHICTNVAQIRQTVAEGKIALLLAFEGARALHGRAGEDSMAMLHAFHALGLRVNCICGAARTMFGDGVGECRPEAGATTFGISLIEEMNRIGMLIDLTHLNDATFFDCIEASSKPVIVSHDGVQAVCPSECNLSDDRLRAIGKNGGVVGMEIVKTELVRGSQETGELVTFDNVIDHIDHIVEVAGIDHVGLGLDYDNFPLVRNVHRAMCPFPGSIEGFYTGIPKGDHMTEDPNDISEGYVIAEYLVNRGYSDNDILKILGGNLMRVLEETIG